MQKQPSIRLAMWSLKAPRQKVPRRRGLQSTLHQISRDTHLFPHVLITRSLVQFKTRKTKNKTKNMLRSLASFLPSLPSSEIPNETPHLGEVDRITFSIFFRVGERTTWLSVRIEGYLRGVKEIKEAVCLTLENYWHSSIRRDCSNGQWHQFMTSMHAKKSEKENVFQTKQLSHKNNLAITGHKASFAWPKEIQHNNLNASKLLLFLWTKTTMIYRRGSIWRFVASSSYRTALKPSIKN